MIKRSGWFAAGIMVVIVFYLSVVSVQASRQVTSEIMSLSTEALQVAEVLDRGGVTPSMAALVKDCSSTQRQEFDTMLSSLSTLTSSELVKLEMLFYACGDYYASTRAMMTYELGQTIEKMSFLTAMPHHFSTSHEEDVLLWQELVELEQERAQLAKGLVSVQGVIIQDLRQGASVESEVIVMQLNEANEIRQALSLLGSDIDLLRAELAAAS